MARCTHTLSIDTDAAILAMKVALARVFHHLTTLTCGVTYQGSGVKGRWSSSHQMQGEFIVLADNR